MHKVIILNALGNVYPQDGRYKEIERVLKGLSQNDIKAFYDTLFQHEMG